MNSLFSVNKVAAFAHYARVRTDSNERKRERDTDMAKAALKKKAAAKKKAPMKKTVAKKLTTKRR